MSGEDISMYLELCRCKGWEYVLLLGGCWARQSGLTGTCHAAPLAFICEFLFIFHCYTEPVTGMSPQANPLAGAVCNICELLEIH